MRAILLAIALIALPPAFSFAQQSVQVPAAETTQATSDPPKPIEPEPIDETIYLEIAPQRAAETQVALKKIEAGLTSDARLERMEADFGADRDSLAERIEAIHDQITRTRRIGQLDRVYSGWQAVISELELDRQDVVDHLAQLEQIADKLEHQAELWRDAQRRAVSDGAEPELADLIDSEVARVAAVRTRVGHEQKVLDPIRLERTRQFLTAGSVLEDIDAARSLARQDLLQWVERPIWIAMTEGAGGRERLAAAGRTLVSDFEQLHSFFASRSQEMVLHGLVIGLLLALFTALKRHSAMWRDDSEELAATLWVVGHPIAMALLLSLMLSNVIYPSAPLQVERFKNLLLLLVLLRLIPHLLVPSLRGFVYLLAGFFVLDRVREWVEAMPLIERIVLDVQAIGALICFSLILRPSRLSLVEGPSFWLLQLSRLIKVSMLVTSVALIASLIGFSNLASLLVGGVLNSAYAGIFLLAIYMLLVSTVRLAMRSRPLLLLNLVRSHRALVEERLLFVVQWGTLFSWVVILFDSFAMRSRFVEFMESVLGAELKVGELQISLLGLISVAVTLAAAIYLGRFIRFVLDEDVTPRLNLPPGVPYAVSASIQYVVLCLGFLAAIAAGGVDLSRFSILAGALGVGVGFGLQNVVNNFVSGVILLFERPVRSGDVIEVREVWGTVRRIGIRSSSVHTFEGAEVIVPNADLISEQVTNWTLSDRRRRIDAKVGVKYGTNPEQVIEILERVGRTHDLIDSLPKPTAYFVGFGDSSLDFQLRAWTSRYEDWYQVLSDINVAINRALAEAGIEIPFPQRDLHLRSSDLGQAEAPS